MVNQYITHATQWFRTQATTVKQRLRAYLPVRQSPFEAGYTIGRFAGVGLVVGIMLAMIAVDPVAAQSSSGDVCDSDLMGFVKNAIGFLVIAAPTVGGLNAVFNMTKAAGTNKPDKKKQAKENIRSSVMYGMAGGMAMSLIGLVTTWGPISYCTI